LKPYKLSHVVTESADLPPKQGSHRCPQGSPVVRLYDIPIAPIAASLLHSRMPRRSKRANSCVSPRMLLCCMRLSPASPSPCKVQMSRHTSLLLLAQVDVKPTEQLPRSLLECHLSEVGSQGPQAARGRLRGRVGSCEGPRPVRQIYTWQHSATCVCTGSD
jgi:hypothetical protein